MNGPPRDEETPEGDAIEQHQAAFPDDDELDDEPATIPDDASEADVLDQSRAVPIEDEYGDR